MALRRGPVPRAALPDIQLRIAAIGSAGDGVASAGEKLHVARTLPGEVVRAQPQGSGRAALVEIVEPSLDRVVPPCPHFSEGCGGCALQHWTDAAYAAWKRGLAVAALERAGFAAPEVGELARTPPKARRRMEFAAEREPGGVRLGLHQAHGLRVVDLSVCHVLDPALFALVAPLRTVLFGLAALRRRGSVTANLTDGGPDLLIRTDGPLAPTDTAKLATFAAAHHITRISWALGNGLVETAAMLTAPFVVFAAQRVDIPPGAFLQASGQGEAAIVRAVLAGLPARLTGRSWAIELFAGCGTISFPLAASLRVLAYEGDAQAAGAVRRAQAGHRLEMTQRDLARQPLPAKEFSGAAVTVLDPPYAGAATQMANIAASQVPRVIYVSCNPGALARDAAVLHQAGYRLLSATPIDQFLWSAHVECVAVFGR